MGIETNYSNEAAKPPAQKKRRPAHKKRPPYVKVLVLAAVVVAVAAALAACALQPMATTRPAANNDQAANTQQAATPNETTQASSKAASPAREDTATQDKTTEQQPEASDSETTSEADADSPSAPVETAVVQESEPQPVWHEGWTETVTIPARYEYRTPYQEYVCCECGMETPDFGEILDHMHQHADILQPGEDGFVAVTRGGYEVLVEPEHQEEIQHPGYWE